MKRKSIRRILSVFLIASLVLCQASFAYGREAGYFKSVEHSALKYSEMKYQRPDLEAFINKSQEIIALSADEAKSGQIIEAFDQLTDMYEQMDIMHSVSRVKADLNVKDNVVAAEYRAMESLMVKGSEIIRKTASAILDSPCGGAVSEVWGSEYCEKVRAMPEISAAEMTLIEKSNALVEEYSEKSVDVYYADINGKRVDLPELSMLYDSKEISYDQYLIGYDAIAKAQNEVLGRIYLDLVRVNNEIAKLHGCENYMEYAYKSYGREYTLQDTKQLHAQVKDIIAPVYMKMYETINYDALSDYAAEQLPAEKTLELYETYSEKIAPELTEAFDYMLEKELIDDEAAEYKFGMSYTIPLTAYGSAFMFINPNDEFYNFKTFIHESGHFLQMYFAPTENILLMGGSVDVSEIHSQALELLFLEYFGDMFGEYGEAARNSVMDGILYAITNGCLVDELEQYAYENPGITLDELNKAAGKILQGYGLPGSDEEYMYDWVNIPHIFQSPGYYISYVTSAISASELWSLSIMDRIDAAETYFTTVKMAEEPYYEVLEAAGLSKPFEPYVLEGIKDAFEQGSQVMVDTYSHWGESFIDLLAYRGVVNGALASDGYTYFYPEDFMTRAEFCKMLFNAVKGQDRTNGKSKPQMFRDVKAESWFSEYVAWASENGIVTGNGKGKFYPDDTITREDMAVMLQRAMEAYVKGVEEQKKSKEFKDRNEISGYALEAVDTLKAGGIITGQPNGNFEPRWSVTKAEGGAAIVRLMRILPS